MKAILIDDYGGRDKLRLAEVPTPEPGPGEALVKVAVCGLNRVDIILRTGMRPVSPMPHILGSEAAGEVAAVGPGVTQVEVGQRVAICHRFNCGVCLYCLRGQETLCVRVETMGANRQGSYAEYVAVPARRLIPIPDSLPFESAAAVCLATATAWHMVAERARVRVGEEVLVLAAGSGVGSAAVQIARLCGARVIAAAGSDEKLAKAKELGAEEGVNYRDPEWATQVRRLTKGRGVDLVVEQVGSDTWENSVACLAPGGRITICGNTSGPGASLDLRTLYGRQISIIGSTGYTLPELEQVLRHVARGELKPVIHAIYPLEQAAEAQRVLEDRQQFGKILLRP